MQYHRSIIQWTIVPNRGAQRSNPSVHREEARRSNTIYSHPLSACCFQTQSDTSHSKSLQCLTERKSPVSKAVGRSHIDPILFQLDRKNPKRHHVSNRNCNRSQIPLFQYIDLSNKSGPLGDIQNRKAHASMTGVTLRSWLNHSLPRTSWLSLRIKLHIEKKPSQVHGLRLVSSIIGPMILLENESQILVQLNVTVNSHPKQFRISLSVPLRLTIDFRKLAHRVRPLLQSAILWQWNLLAIFTSEELTWSSWRSNCFKVRITLSPQTLGSISHCWSTRRLRSLLSLIQQCFQLLLLIFCQTTISSCILRHSHGFSKWGE